MSETSRSALTRPEQIEGTLQEPLTVPLGNGEGFLITYHWESEEGEHTFLHLTVRHHPGSPFAIARSNIDSEEIRGQGDALWTFLGNSLQEMSTTQDMNIVHEVHANEHSLRLPAEDPRYHPSPDGTAFLGIYSPQATPSIVSLSLFEER
jgi:hypothetical protein